ncbi:hypothetical protein SAMN04487917_101374 [Arthrobacter sp. yr096]|uniref:hypothetical protein n=1 Tax=Arthrobacter sp. yr096 TaxID=1761750 RepID=UPI0008B87121|nr:hypothetical protein [Arthrobacter sp. yr096]SEI45336.1 hypothetical protein SAMN04487917_101374 [Arthrobacter sp. yr096]
MTESMEGQEMLPGRWPEPVLTCDLIIARELTDALSHQERFSGALSASMEFPVGDKSDAAMAAKYKMSMYLQAYIASAAISDLLRKIQGLAPGLADQIAREFNDLHESGEQGELIWEWAAERGLDPADIINTVKHGLAQEETP